MISAPCATTKLRNKTNEPPLDPAVVFLLGMIFISAGKLGVMRRVRYCVSTVIFQTLIGGGVYFSYTALDRLLDIGKIEELKSSNRRFLILAVIIFFATCMLKLMIHFFGSIRGERQVSVTLEYKGRALSLDAFVDSGNLAVDPMDKTPLMLIKAEMAKNLFGEDCFFLEHPENAGYELKKRIRVIPVSYGKRSILYGIKPDLARIKEKRSEREVTLLVAIDREGGSFGGYMGLVPISLLD